MTTRHEVVHYWLSVFEILCWFSMHHHGIIDRQTCNWIIVRIVVLEELLIGLIIIWLGILLLIAILKQSWITTNIVVSSLFDVVCMRLRTLSNRLLHLAFFH